MKLADFQQQGLCTTPSVSWALFYCPFFLLLQDLDTAVLLPDLIVSPPKKLLTQSWMLKSLVKSYEGRALWCVAFLSICSVINFFSVKLSWSPLWLHLVNSCLVMNRTLKLKNGENPASQTLCGGNMLLISCLGLLSGSPGIEEAWEKNIRQNHRANSTVSDFWQFTAKEEWEKV